MNAQADPGRWRAIGRIGPASAGTASAAVRHRMVALRRLEAAPPPAALASPMAERGMRVPRAATVVIVAVNQVRSAAPRRRSVARIVALWASVALHGAAAAMLLAAPAPEALVAGGAVVQVSLIGNDEMDLIAGGPTVASADTADPERSQAVPPSPPASEAERVVAAEPVGAAPSALTGPVAVARAAVPVRAETLLPVTTDRLPPVTARSVAATEPEAILPLSPVVPDATDAAQAQRVSPAAPETAAATAPPAETLQPAPNEPAEAWAEAVRPQRRPEARNPTPAKPAEPRRKAAGPPPAATGNSDRDAARGSAEGAEGGTAKATGKPGKTATASGNAAVSNYPGLVLRKIERTRRASGAGRGTAVVAFAVAESGGLASVSVVRSSGNAKLDTMAADHIRRAAPFPPPPAGAQRKFRFEFVGR